MKRIKSLLMLLLCCVQLLNAQTVNADLASGQRTAYATARRLMGRGNTTYKYYVSQTTVKKNGEARWLVFVDKMPKAGWEHPCTYVYTKPGNNSTANCIAVDSVCPPSDIRLVPAVKSNGSTDTILKMNVGKGPENPYASHTYAIILSGGKDKNSNSSRYWNDCSFIYKTMTKKYNR